jgi:5-methylcytosine-specific restriction endonuclease McrA
MSQKCIRIGGRKLPYEARALLDVKCAYCDEPSETIDHVIPRHRGGTDDLSNLIGACAFCNQSKGALTPEEFRLVREAKARGDEVTVKRIRREASKPSRLRDEISCLLP